MNTESYETFNPSNGNKLGNVTYTKNETIKDAFKKSKEIQKKWSEKNNKIIINSLLTLRENIINEREVLADLISKENGKPKFEALAHEIFPIILLISFFVDEIGKKLKPKNIPMNLMIHRKSILTYEPMGVIAVISPWNYPFLLPLGEIIMAVATKNSVLFKPSEITPLIGLKIQSLFESAGFPVGLVQTIIGDGKAGIEIINNKPDKIFFTGSVTTGKNILKQAAEFLIPVNLELGGKDPMIVLEDADLELASSAAVWGAFTNSGQICASVERIIIHENIKNKFLDLTLKKIKSLTQSDPSTRPCDLGSITFEKQKSVYKRHLEDAKMRNLTILSGGKASENDRFYSPTVITGDGIEDSLVYKEETFGPFVAVTTFKNIEEAIQKANDTNYGLTACIFTKNIGFAKSIAHQIDAGTIMINEVVYTAGLSETPWGGRKDSGFGRKHSSEGLLDFVHTKHIHLPKYSFLNFKSFWWFPYSTYQYQFFNQCFLFYRKNLFNKLKSIPSILWNFIQFIKHEPRL